MADTRDLKSLAEKHEGSTPSPRTIYIIVFTDGMIESAWTSKLLAEVALKEHSEESGCPEDYYHIAIRELNQLKQKI